MTIVGFPEYFIAQADLADELYLSNREINCYITATTAIDALAEIWKSDFPTEAEALSREFGGTVPSSIRMSRFVRRFAADSRADKIAVLRFAEDASRFAPSVATSEVSSLLGSRAFKANTSSPAHLDLDLAALSREAPTLLSNSAVRKLVEEYFYPALLYSFYRCPMVHTLGWSRQTQAFARNDEVMYLKLEPDFTSIGFGPDLVTHWLRASLSGYLDECERVGVRPAGSLEPGAGSEQRLRGKWAKL